MFKKPIKFRISKVPEYNDWFDEQSLINQVLIKKRLARIESDGHFGNINKVGVVVWELKWENGLRVYYVYVVQQKILLLLGGTKNGQQKDINQAKRIFKKHCEA
jgi:putative addiction module killer protein